jgi:septum formation inhibitor-activating ATPase MinD
MVKPVRDVDRVFGIIRLVIMRVIPDTMTIRAAAQGEPVDLQANLEIPRTHRRHCARRILTGDGFSCFA